MRKRYDTTGQDDSILIIVWMKQLFCVSGSAYYALRGAYSADNFECTAVLKISPSHDIQRDLQTLH